MKRKLDKADYRSMTSFEISVLPGRSPRGDIVIRNGPAEIRVDVLQIINDLETKTGNHADADAMRERLGLLPWQHSRPGKER